jgi:hypothetical protein
VKTTIIISAALLGGCALAKPDGTEGWVIYECVDVARCYRKAAEVCGGKYEILHQSTHTSGAVIGGTGVIDSSYTMTIKCEEKPER